MYDKKKNTSLLESIVWLVFFILAACEEPKQDFYKDEMEAFDVWRIPIVKPYRLITADCLSAEGCNGWNFGSRDFSEHFSVDSLNYDNNYILFYSPYNGDNYIAIDVIQKKVYKFAKVEEYRAFLREKKVDNELYSVHYVRDSWKATKELPWKGAIVER